MKENGSKICTLRGHSDWVSSCEYAPSEFKVVSGSRDKTIRVWDSISCVSLFSLQDHKWEVG